MFSKKSKASRQDVCEQDRKTELVIMWKSKGTRDQENA